MYAVVCISLHAYFLRIVTLAFPGDSGALHAGLWLCLVMTAVLALSRALQHAGEYKVARGLSFAGAPWLVLLTWFCALALPMDLWNLAVGKAGQSLPALAALRLPPRPTLALLVLLVALAGLWSLGEAYRVRLKQVTFHTSRLTKPVRILHVSDAHFNLLAGERRLRRIVRLIEKAEADIVVSTGDMVDGRVPKIERFARRLDRINPPLGKYAVLGNHEFYSGVPASLAFFEAAGFEVIRGECVTVRQGLRLAGVDDPVGHRMGFNCWSDEDNVLPPRSHSAVTVLLKHRPAISKKAVGRFDLQLSGHTHGGQISTDRLGALRYPLRTGFHQLGDEAAAYVSRGAGTWGAPMRLFSPPEVTLINIKPIAQS